MPKLSEEKVTELATKMMSDADPKFYELYRVIFNGETKEPYWAVYFSLLDENGKPRIIDPSTVTVRVIGADETAFFSTYL